VSRVQRRVRVSEPRLRAADLVLEGDTGLGIVGHRHGTRSKDLLGSQLVCWTHQEEKGASRSRHPRVEATRVTITTALSGVVLCV
jgi:hypothetical protein